MDSETKNKRIKQLTDMIKSLQQQIELLKG